jgi:hypothetical protein
MKATFTVKGYDHPIAIDGRGVTSGSLKRALDRVAIVE